jgi:sulfate transport system substrate-binding protein
VLIAWENEAHLLVNQLSKDQFEIVYPSLSILAEPPVSLVDRNVDKHRTRDAAQAFLEFLYTEPAQELIAKHYYRPRSQAVMSKHAARFPAIELLTIDQHFGGWKVVQKKHFDDGGIFDQIYAAD